MSVVTDVADMNYEKLRQHEAKSIVECVYINFKVVKFWVCIRLKVLPCLDRAWVHFTCHHKLGSKGRISLPRMNPQTAPVQRKFGNFYYLEISCMST